MIKYFFNLSVLLGTCTGVLSQVPRLVIPAGHSRIVTNAHFSADGKYIATASSDNTAKIWDAKSGRLLQTLSPSRGVVNDFGFSGNSAFLYTITPDDSTMRVWEIHTGNELLALRGQEYAYGHMIFSNDSRVLFVITDLGIDTWDLATRKPLRKFQFKVKTSDSSAAVFFDIARDNRTVVLIENHKPGITFWDVVSGTTREFNNSDVRDVRMIRFSNDHKSLYAYTGKSMLVIDLHSGTTIHSLPIYDPALQASAVTPDGKWLLNAFEEQPLYRVVNGDTIQNGNEQGAFHPSMTDINTGKRTYLRGELPTGNIVLAHFDRQGKQLIAQGDSDIYIYSIEEAKLYKEGRVRHFKLNNIMVEDWMEISQNSKYFVTGDGWTPQIYDMKGVLQRELNGSINYGSRQHFNDDGKLIYAPLDSLPNLAWDVLAGQFKTVPGSIKPWIPEKTKPRPELPNPFYDESVNQWKIARLHDTVTLRDKFDDKSWEFSASGKYMASWNSDSLVRIWDVSTGRKVNKIFCDIGSPRSVFIDETDRFVVMMKGGGFTSPGDLDAMWSALEKKSDSTENGKDSAVNTYTPAREGITFVKVADIKTGKILCEHYDSSGFIQFDDYAFSEQSKYFISYRNKIQVWDTRTWREVMNIDNHTGFSTPYWDMNVESARMILSGDNKATIFEPYTNKPLFIFPVSVKLAFFSKDGKYILTESDDRKLRVWNANDNKLLYTYYGFDNGNYLVTDEYGRYDGTEEARKKLYYVCGDEIIDLDQIKDLCWEPGLAGKIMSGDTSRIRAKKLSSINICGITPRVEEIQEKKEGAISFLITPQSGGLGDILVFVMDKQVRTCSKKDLVQTGNSYKLTIDKRSLETYFVNGNNNTITVRALTADGMMQGKGGIVSVKGERKDIVMAPHLYCISAGISEYKGEKLKLTYAAKDAVDFSNALGAAARRLLNTTGGEDHVHVYCLSTENRTNAWPSKNNIKQAFREVAAKSKADDILVVFLSGHGVLKEQKQLFYYLASETTSFDITGVEKEVAISTDELNEWMRNIKAQKQVLIIDACNSGQVVQQSNMVRHKGMDPDQQRALERLKDRTGSYILSASASGQSAYETSFYNQGLLTYSLLYAIKTGGGLKDNKYIDVSKWFNFAADEVKNMASDIGGRQDPKIMGNASIDVGMVDKEVLNSIQLSLRKNIFRRSQFLDNTEDISDELALGVLMDEELNKLNMLGRASNIVFVADNTSEDAYSLRGKYEVNGNEIVLKASLYKGNKEKLYQSDFRGTVDKKRELVIKVLDKMGKFLKEP